MSDLREKVGEWLVELEYENHSHREVLDAILALVERSAVERERKAFVAGVKSAEGYIDLNPSWVEDEVSRRYPLPKEER